MVLLTAAYDKFSHNYVKEKPMDRQWELVRAGL
jgi:hypothetical protein